MSADDRLNPPTPRGLKAIPGSVIDLPEGLAFLARGAQGLCLVTPKAAGGFTGESFTLDGREWLVGPLTGVAAQVLRAKVQRLRPRPLAAQPSFGFGDRVGVTTTGHAQAMRTAGNGLAAVFAQQSPRELQRTGRSFTDVLDAATWNVLASGWDDAFGADGDHLKTEEDILAAARAGFTMFTLDPSDLIDATAGDLGGRELEMRVEALPWLDLEDDLASLRRRYLALPDFDEAGLYRAAATYGRAVARVVALYRGLDALLGEAYDLEISLDETPAPTSASDHLYVASELARLGVHWTSLAPHLPGRWEKGIDWRGDADELRSAVAAHLRIADNFDDYKLAVHSGSDKLAAYPVIWAASEGRVHVKTSGTSYLEGLRVVAGIDQGLFRSIAVLAREQFAIERATYAISARDPFHNLDAISDSALPALLDQESERQCLHVAYGSVLRDASLAPRFRELLAEEEEAYADDLRRHFVHHLRALTQT